MKELLQSYDTGELRMVEVGRPRPGRGQLLVRTVRSAVSVGTEKAMIDMARKSLVGKALARPDWVRQVVDKARNEGALEAWRQAKARLGTPVPLGYSSAGVVVDVGDGVTDWAPGDRVACSGSGYARHAELVAVPRNMCAPVPPGVSFEDAAFVALGGIAVEAVRMAEPELGSRVGVLGLGLLGLLTLQLLRAAGCRVLAADLDPAKLDLARALGADAVADASGDLAAAGRALAGEHGLDAVIIMASTPSNRPLEQAAELVRDRGRVVATGLVGLDVPREPFYEKEIELVVSRAWGPGMYDPDYEERDVKYPLAYVRWTAARNMEAFLELVGEGKIRMGPLVSHRFPFADALEAYELLTSGDEPYVGVVLEFPEEARAPEGRRVVVHGGAKVGSVEGEVGVGLLGAGLFARGTLLPALAKVDGLRMEGVATNTGASGRHAAELGGFRYATTDPDELLADDAVDLVLVLTRHGSHADLAVRALEAGKHVFVEKPLAATPAQLRRVDEAYRNAVEGAGAGGPPLLMVGFNRRFSPFTVWLRERLAEVGEPLGVQCTVNAGAVPRDHWIYEPGEGGGRIVGEMCHFVDLAQALTGSLPIRAHAETLAGEGYHPTDNVAATLRMADGSVASITYLAGGSKRHPRERVEVYGGGGVGVIRNFKSAVWTRGGTRSRSRNWLEVDRGHVGELDALARALREGGPPPVPFESYLATTRATFALEASLGRGGSVEVDEVGATGDPPDGDTGRGATGEASP